MQLKPFILIVILILDAFLHLVAAAVYDPILKELKPGTITIIGETHRRAESVQMFQSLMIDYLRQKKCLSVGLEIASDQQPFVDPVMQGRASAYEIKISTIIDHPPMRKMIDNMVALKRKGACLKVIAIDTGIETEHNRDVWMSKQLAKLTGNDPILVLLGGLHTLKIVDWDLSMTESSPSVSEILVSKGYQVKTYPQIWRKADRDKQCERTSRYISVGVPEALALLNEHLISLINAFPAKMATDVVDGFIVWECSS